ncbi:hypothetical protein HRbin29_01651 [bacterium HR29]|nr:hypothetical protein HRbin29_01651 [bacterium HR29]
METEALLERLAVTPRRLAQLVADASDVALDAAPAGAWSAREVLAHLRDLELLVWRTGFARILVEEEPELPAFDQAAWALRRWRGRDRKEQLLGDFALQRQALLNAAAQLDAEHWERRGRITGGREVSLRGWLEAVAAHDDEHFAQLERLLGYTHAEAMERRRRWAEEWRP